MANKGFTLIETFGAITILILAVLGPLSLLARNISDGALIKNQIAASYLAQEAIEMAIHERDINRGSGALDFSDAAGWLGSLGKAVCQNEDGCFINLNSSGDIETGPCDDESCDIVLGSAPTGEMVFTRKVIVEPFDTAASQPAGSPAPYFWATEGAKITVIMSWDFKGLTKSYLLSTVIYNNVVQQKIEVVECLPPDCF